MQLQFVCIDDLIINLANITYITKRKITENGKEDTRISIFLIGEQQPIEIWASPVARLFLNGGKKLSLS